MQQQPTRLCHSSIMQQQPTKLCSEQATQAMNSRLGEMDEKKIQIPLEMEREADMMNYKSGIQEHIANMFLDHDPFHAVLMDHQSAAAQSGLSRRVATH